MDIETKPNAQIPAGNARNDLTAAEEDWLSFEGRVSMWAQS
jgi:hypothetical protein